LFVLDSSESSGETVDSLLIYTTSPRSWFSVKTFLVVTDVLKEGFVSASVEFEICEKLFCRGVWSVQMDHAKKMGRRRRQKETQSKPMSGFLRKANPQTTRLCLFELFNSTELKTHAIQEKPREARADVR